MGDESLIYRPKTALSKSNHRGELERIIGLAKAH